MATFLDIGLVGFFDTIFAVILVWTIVFAIFQKTKAVSEAIGINSVIAVAISFLVLISPNLVKVIKFAVPWFAILILFVVLILLLFQIFGFSDLTTAVNDTTIRWTLIGLSLVIVIAAMGNVFGQQLLEQVPGGAVSVAGAPAGEGQVAGPEWEQNVYATLFHPKVIGMIILFLVAIFAIVFLSGTP